MRKIKAALRLLLCSNYLLIVKDKQTDYTSIDYTISSFEAKRYGLFLHNYLTETEAAIDEVNRIINSKN